MPQANKRAPKHKDKGDKNSQSGSQSQEDEPDLEILSRELEKRAKKQKRTHTATSTDAEAGPSSPKTLVLRAPESLPSDLIQEMQSEIAAMKRQSKEQKEEVSKLKAKLVASDGVDYQWKKEGNKRQYEVMYKAISATVQAKNVYRDDGLAAGDEALDNLVATYRQRIKMLRIVDTSPHGWQTVQEYEVNPIANDEADDQKLRRAEKAAQEKLAARAQERRAKQSRFQKYNQGYNNYRQGQNQDNNKGENNTAYRSYGGFKNQNAYKSSTVVPEKSTPKRNINNDICFSCGSRGHWANHCPENKQAEEKSDK